MKKLTLFILALLLSISAFGQGTSVVRTNAVNSVPSLPSTCNPNDWDLEREVVYLNSGTIVGQQTGVGIYECTAANTWTRLAVGGGGGALNGGPLTVNTLPKATGAQALGDSTVTDNGVIVSSSEAINSVTGFQFNSTAPSGQFLRGNGTNFVAGAIQAADLPPSALACSGLTTNALLKWTGTVCASSTVIDDGTNSTAHPNGVTVQTAAYYIQRANANPGTTVNLAVSLDASGNAVTTATTPGIVYGIAGQGAGNAGNVQISIFGEHLWTCDNQTVARDWLIASVTNAGQCHDAGASEPTGVQNVARVVTINTGAGTTTLADIFAIGDVVNASGGGRGTAVQIKGTNTQPTANFNNTAPIAQANSLNILWQSSNSGAVTSVSAEVPYSAPLNVVTGNLTVSGAAGTVLTGQGAAAQATFVAVPASANVIGTNASSTFIAATAHAISVPRNCAAASASGTAYTCTTSPSFVPADGDEILFEADVANTGSATLNVNASSAATINKQGGGTNLVANDLLAGQDAILIFDGTNWQMQSQLGNAVAGLSGLTSPIIPRANSATSIINGSLSDTGAGVQATASAIALVFQGGQDASANSALGAVTIRGADETGAGGATSQGGGALIRGGNNAATNTASQAGSVETVPGLSTGATQGLQGVNITNNAYVKGGGTSTQWNLQCLVAATARTVNDCGATPETWLGVADTVGSNTVLIHIPPSQTPVNASAAVTLGHTVCAGSTVGKVTDSGGTTSCTNTQGATVGVVVDTSGTQTLGDGGTVTFSTTLPLVALNTASRLPAAAAGGAATTFPLEGGSPDTTGSVGYTVTALTAYRNGHWEWIEPPAAGAGTAVDLYFHVRAPHTIPSGTAKISLDFAANDGTAGRTVTFKTCDAVVTTTTNVASLTCASTQNFTTTTTARAPVTLLFTVQSTITADSELIVDIEQTTETGMLVNMELQGAYLVWQ